MPETITLSPFCNPREHRIVIADRITQLRSPAGEQKICRLYSEPHKQMSGPQARHSQHWNYRDRADVFQMTRAFTS